MRGFIPAHNDEERLFVKRVKELAGLYEAKYVCKATMFLSDRQQELARAALFDFKGEYLFEGGYDNAERKLLSIGETINEAKQRISCVCIILKSNEKSLTHRDYLGAFLSLGIKREYIGDIVKGQNERVYSFTVGRVADLLCNELRSVGRATVQVHIVSELPLLMLESVEILTATIASLRLDVALAAMLKLSRNDAQALIKGGKCEVNHIAINSAHYEIENGDVFSIKEHGKYKLCEIGGKSRKDKVFINYQKY